MKSATVAQRAPSTAAPSSVEALTATAINRSSSAATSGRRQARSPSVCMKPRRQVSVIAPVGVQPMNWDRLVASANTAFTALSIAVWYCSTPCSDETTAEAPMTAKLPFQLSASRSATLTSTPKTSRTALRNCDRVKRRSIPAAGWNAGGLGNRGPVPPMPPVPVATVPPVPVATVPPVPVATVPPVPEEDMPLPPAPTVPAPP